MKTIQEKILIAESRLAQWCDGDADQELEIYNTKNGTSLTFESDIEDIGPFYTWLYDNGLNENN